MVSALLVVFGIGGLAVAGALLATTVADTVYGRVRTTRTLRAIREGAASPATVTSRLEAPLTTRLAGPAVKRLSGLGLRLLPDDAAATFRRRIASAGSPQGWTVDRVIAGKLIGLGLGWLVGLTVALAIGVRPVLALLVSVLVGIAGYFTPELVLYQLAYDRTERIRADLPDALDLLTISVDAGMPFDSALRQVAASTSGPLRGEFGRLVHETDFGLGRPAALRAFGERVGLAEARTLASALSQADTLGVPIAKVLRIQSTQLRQARSAKLEEQAQKLPVKIIFPLVLCILPALLVVVIGPAAIELTRSFRP